MGMAAGQARLLSITSRISDNELRAQLINNDKIRLATQSSQVSEAYVQALNDASLMFTNYDADNNASYKQLTFNSLTAYSPYNNQYALSNASGKILVSEDDAFKFSQSKSLEEFLGKYNLKQTTTYWNSIATYLDGNGNNVAKYPTEEVDSNGNTVYSAPYYPSELKTWYEGDSSHICTTGVEKCSELNKHSYMDIVTSNYYYNYSSKLETYENNRAEMLQLVYSTMVSELDKLLPDNTTLNDLERAIGDLLVDQSMLSGAGKTYLTEMQTLAHNTALGYSESKVTPELDNSNTNRVNIGEDLAIDFSTTPAKVLIPDEAGIYNDETNNVNYTNNNIDFYTKDDDTNNIVDISKSDNGGTQIEYFGVPASIPTNLAQNPFSEVTVRTHLTPDEQETQRKNIIQLIKANVTHIFNPSAFIPKVKNLDKDKFDAFNNAGEELVKATLGNDYTTTPNPIDDTELLDFYNCFTDPITLCNTFNNNTTVNIAAVTVGLSASNSQTQLNNLQALKQVSVLDAFMNTYGEPKYTWIDTSNNNEDATAKAQWYTNLYDRMIQGYTVLKDGLASSPEWIKFAFESGLVNMEQIDSFNCWNNIIYTNCSDITEQTDSTAVAKAEAEYNAAMNKIENKDKMYDLELKNIDTEHTSLETEYESIKSAIEKNIDRTFKIYT